MRPCSARSFARFSSTASGSSDSSEIGLWFSRCHRSGSMSRKIPIVSWSQLHQRLRASVHRRSCVGATNRCSTRAAVMIGVTCSAAATSASTSSVENRRGAEVCTTRAPCSTPSSTSGTPRNDWKSSSPASRKRLKRGCDCACSTASGPTCSATRPTRPSCSARRTCPTDACRRPTVAARIRLALSGSSRYAEQTSLPNRDAIRRTTRARTAVGSPPGSTSASISSIERPATSARFEVVGEASCVPDERWDTVATRSAGRLDGLKSSRLSQVLNRQDVYARAERGPVTLGLARPHFLTCSTASGMASLVKARTTGSGTAETCGNQGSDGPECSQSGSP